MKTTKNKKRNAKVLAAWVIVFVIIGLIIIRTSLVPIDSFSAGCPVRRVRLSLVNGGRQKMDEVRKRADERQKQIDELEKSNPGIQPGCRMGALYELYIL